MCKHWLIGACQYGENCYNLHPEDQRLPGAAAREKTGGSSQSKGPKPCYFFNLGKCKFGDKCRYVREDPPAAPAKEKEKGGPKAKAKAKAKVAAPARKAHFGSNEWISYEDTSNEESEDETLHITSLYCQIEQSDDELTAIHVSMVMKSAASHWK